METRPRAGLHQGEGDRRLTRRPPVIPKRPVPALAHGPWDVALGVTACLAVAVFPLIPDEKLNRLKLVALELGVLAVLAAVGARTLSTGGLLHDAPANGPMRARWSVFYATPVAVAAWFGMNVLLSFIASDKALAFSELRRVGLAAASYFAFRLARLDDRWTTRLLLTWTAVALLEALYATLQQKGGIGPILVPQMDRVIGTFGNPIFLAAYLTLSLFVATAARRSTLRDSERIFAFCAVVLIVPAIAASQTRAAYVGLVAAAVSAVVFSTAAYRRKTLWIAAAVVGLALFLSFPLWKREQAHLLIWRDTFRLIADNPLLGVGLGAFHVHFPPVAQPDLIAKWPVGQFVVNHAHNEFLQALAEGGPLLFLSFTGVFAVFFAAVWRRSGPADRHGPAAPIALGVLAVAVQNLFSVDMRFSVSLATTFMAMGIATAEGRTWPRTTGDGTVKPGRIALAVAWVAFLGWVGYRFVWAPHAAQRQVAAAPGFFDERLLDPARTIGELETLVAKYPSEPAAVEKLAFAYAKEMKHPDGSLNHAMGEKAADAFRKAITLEPAAVSAHNNLGNVLFTLGRPEEAMAQWRRAAELDPKFLDPRLNLGKVLYLQGDLRGAASQFQEVLKLQPSHPEASLYLRRMVE